MSGSLHLLSTRQTERVLARMEAGDLIHKRGGRGWEFIDLLDFLEADGAEAAAEFMYRHHDACGSANQGATA
jgi:hypothetical protein